ncbi:MAG TPA: undecaprenyl-diphosphate phosphatase [Candidatus Dormibacteraeota bacterium]|jgi:undecaprenyl-diphosphatase|nr:undecaprenyl-diphosphate phosphatase [Candidatus Dormibacteraeota bacterium]
MSFWQAIFLGFLQGATELFPVSSLGHAVLLPKLLGWSYDQSSPEFLPYIVLLHLGTAAALLVYFRQDWIALARAFFAAVARGSLGADPNERLALLLLAGTVPTAVIAGLFKKDLEKLFANPRLAAVFLIVNGAVMGTGELLRRQAERRRPAVGTSGAGATAAASTVGAAAREAAFAEERELGFGAALVVGASQSLALLPGISRSGSTITAGLLSGLSHEAAARFSFFLATPIILAAGLVEVGGLASTGGRLPRYLAGAAVAGVTAYLSVRFLLRYFRSGRLDPFAIYCVALGLAGLLLIH